jgi:2-polyprenyl-6-methoxyphenol hydroxylase-like FAD-dependent oxidoreductase
MSSSQPPKIAIIGAGPSGLTLAVLLHKRSIPFAVYDLRPEPTPASLSAVSGMLDLHVESGLAALKACGLYDSFLPLTHECGQAMRVMDADGVITYSDEGDLEFRPEISRHALTKLLLSALPQDAVRWEHKLRSARRQEGGKLLLGFGDGEVVEADLVVGADGAWSKIRRELIPDADTPRYTGVQTLTVTITDITTRYPALAQLVGEGAILAMGTGNVVSSHRGAQDSVRLYVGVGTDDEQFALSRGFVGKTAEEIMEEYLTDENLFGRWGEQMKELIRTACREETAREPEAKADIRPIYELPVGHSWEHCPGVTLIGDAAHLMTPWAGEGANISMWDALDLAGAIEEAWKASSGGKGASWAREMEPRLMDFEKMMTERAASRADMSSKNGRLILQENATRLMADMFKSFGPPPE